MKKIDDDIKKIVMRAAGEESSVYDLICELRPEIMEGNSLTDLKMAIDNAFDIINKYKDLNIIDFYGSELLNSKLIQNDIYNTYLFIPR